MNNYGVIFDMDGVLVDSYDAHFQSWLIAGKRFGLELAEEDFAKTFGRTSRDIINRLWPGLLSDEQIMQFDKEKEADYRQILPKMFKEMPGAGELIRQLHDAGFRLAIGSSGAQKNIDLVKEHLTNGALLNVVVNGSEVKQGKPDPQVFLIAAKKLKLEPKFCAVIEDAPVGIEAARRAGETAIGLTGTAPRKELEERAHRVVDSLSELSPSVIAQLIRLNAERT